MKFKFVFVALIILTFLVVAGYYFIESNQIISLADTNQIIHMNSSYSGKLNKPIQLVEEGRSINIMENEESGTYEFSCSIEDNLVIIEVMGEEYIADRDDIIALISKYTCKRTWKDYGPYTSERIDVRFDFVQVDASRFILLGDFNIMYMQDGKTYEIINGDSLRDEIVQYIEDKKV